MAFMKNNSKYCTTLDDIIKKIDDHQIIYILYNMIHANKLS